VLCSTGCFNAVVSIGSFEALARFHKDRIGHCGRDRHVPHSPIPPEARALNDVDLDGWRLFHVARLVAMKWACSTRPSWRDPAIERRRDAEVARALDLRPHVSGLTTVPVDPADHPPDANRSVLHTSTSATCAI